MKYLSALLLSISFVSITTFCRTAAAQSQTLNAAQDSLTETEREKQWFTDVEYVNTPRLTWGLNTDISYITQSIRPQRFWRISNNFLGIGATDKVNGVGTNIGAFLDIPLADNIVGVRFGITSERTSYQNIEQIGLQSQGMPGTLKMVDLEQSLSLELHTITIGASFRRRVINSLFAELGADAVFLTRSNLNYTERIDDFFLSGMILPQEYEGELQQTQTYFQAFGGASYNFPWHSGDIFYILSPYIRYYYPLTPLTSMVDWRTSRFCLGLEVRW